MQPVLEIIGGTTSASLNAIRESLAAKRPNWHYHPEIELTYMAQGHARMQVGNHVASCKAGDLIVLGPNLPHDFNPVEPPASCDFLVVQFRRELLANFPEMARVSAFLDEAAGGLLLEDCAEELATLFEDIDTAEPAHRLALLLKLVVILSDCGEAGWQPLSRLSVVQQVTEGRNHQRLQIVIGTILDNFHRRISLREMADLLHMAPPSFSRWFHRTMQMTFTGYLNHVRIEECCRQLRFTDKPITTIAKDCGFESFSSFNRQFRRRKGCAPREWRKGRV